MNLPSESAGWAKAEGFLTDPMDAYRNGEIRDLTKAQIAAIENGADIGRVVNATRGMSTTATRRTLGKRATKMLPSGALSPVIKPGTPDLLAGLRKSVAARQTATGGLLTPEGIYQQANGDRDEAIRLLRHWGYLD